MKSLFEKMIGVKIPCGYGWDGEGIVRIGAKRDIRRERQGYGIIIGDEKFRRKGGMNISTRAMIDVVNRDTGETIHLYSRPAHSPRPRSASASWNRKES